MHRRSRSESDAQTRSRTAAANEQALNNTNENHATKQAVRSDLVSSFNTQPGRAQLPVSGSLHLHPNVKRTTNAIAPTAPTRIFELETQNAELKDANHTWAEDFGILYMELLETRSDLYAELQKGICQQRQAKVDVTEIKRLEKQLAQYEEFIGRMVDIGLHEGVLNQAHAGLQAGQDADVALINAIQEAAAKPGSAWARMIPLIHNYERRDVTLNVALRIRKELKDWKRVARFWKRAALRERKQDETASPSASSISSIAVTRCSEYRTNVDDLLTEPPRDRYKNQSQRLSLLPRPTRTNSTDVVKLPITPEPDECPSRVYLSVSSSAIQGPYVPNLADLAIVPDKQGAVQNASKRTFVARPINTPVLGDVNLNNGARPTMLQSGSTTTQTLFANKRKTMQSFSESIKTTARSAQRSHHPSSPSVASSTTSRTSIAFATDVPQGKAPAVENHIFQGVIPTSREAVCATLTGTSDLANFDSSYSLSAITESSKGDPDIDTSPLHPFPSPGNETTDSAYVQEYSVTESVSTAPTTPHNTPVKSSKFPVVSHRFRRFCSRAQIASSKATGTLHPLIRKKNRARTLGFLTNAPAVLTPIQPSASYITEHISAAC